MILDDLFNNGSKPDEGEHAQITENKNFPVNEQLEKNKEYQQDQSNNKASNDPTADRYTGANGYTERADQKDQLENLSIGGGEGQPMGGSHHTSANEQAQGPGFEGEGSYELDHAGNIRTREQEFGANAPSGPATPAIGGETISGEQ